MIAISRTRGKYSEFQIQLIFLLPLGISGLFAWMNPLVWNKAFCGDGFIWTMYILRLSGISQLSGANRTETSNILKAHLTDVSSLSSCYILPLLTQSICMLIRCREFYCWAGPCNKNHKLRKYSTFKTCSTSSNVKWTETNWTVFLFPWVSHFFTNLGVKEQGQEYLKFMDKGLNGLTHIFLLPLKNPLFYFSSYKNELRRLSVCLHSWGSMFQWKDIKQFSSRFQCVYSDNGMVPNSKSNLIILVANFLGIILTS